jgi:hypothetical protein
VDRRVVTFAAGLASGQTRWPGHDDKAGCFRLNKTDSKGAVVPAKKKPRPGGRRGFVRWGGDWGMTNPSGDTVE